MDTQGEKLMDIFLEPHAVKERAETKAQNLLDLPKDEAAKILTMIFTQHAEDIAKLRTRLEGVEGVMHHNFREVVTKMEEAAEAASTMKDYLDEFEADMLEAVKE